MDRKAAQRIISIFVLMALTIISLPFFFSKDETISDIIPAANKAPPFATQPEEAITKPITETPAATPPALSTTQSSLSSSPQQQEEALASAIAAAHQSSATTKPAADSTAAQITTISVASKPAAQDAPLFPVIPVQITPGKQPGQNTVVNVSKNTNNHSKVDNDIIIKSFDIVTAFSIPSKQLNFSHNKELHKPVWVVQVGNFKNKTNARHLTDYLRAEGFKAFTKTVNIKGEDTIQVFVGPELKQASASQLSNRVMKQTNLRGKVVAFNALAL